MSRGCAMTALAICVLLRCHTEKKTGLYHCTVRRRQAVRLP